MADKEIAVIDGNTFLLSDTLGEIVAGTPHGLYYADTRFLSTYTMKLNGQHPVRLSAGNLTSTLASFYATNPATKKLPQGSLSITRDRMVSGGIHDEIAVISHSHTPLALTLTFAFAADFADVFEVRSGNIVKMGTVKIERGNGHHAGHEAGHEHSAERSFDLVFTYHRAEFVRSTLISFSQPAEVKDNRVTFRFTLPAKGEWRTRIDICPRMEAFSSPASHYAVSTETGDSPLLPSMFRNGTAGNGAGSDKEVTSDSPRLLTEDARLRFAFDRAIKDLAGLRLAMDGGYQLPVAGLPWYMAVFGRDSIITALQTLILGPELAIGTLHTLAGYQSRRLDVFRDEEPGKIPHEIRFGELASLDEVPHSRYYGTADATPLFVVLLSETYRWTGDSELLRHFLPNLNAALTWIDKYGDHDGDGFIEYARRSLHGLVNQGWKDSPDSVCFVDGAHAAPPIALAEVQGYVYDAKIRAAEIFAALGDFQRAEQLSSQARELKRRFNEEFWMPAEDFFAIALDGDKNRVGSITSNPGHCLWSGIIDEDKAEAVAGRLMSPDMFGGWGIRTMSSSMPAYNPISYHNGSVWPHDNSIIAAGLARYGFAAAALAVIDALLDASTHFPHHRLPELYAGFPRRSHGFPVEYVGANSPQAWAAGAVVLMTQTLLGAAPMAARLANDALADAPRIRLSGVPYRGGRVDLAAPNAAA